MKYSHPPASPTYIFGDESSDKGDSNFLVYGVVILPEHRGKEIRGLLDFPDFDHEFHWKRCASHIRQHKKFVTTLFDCIHQREMKFECIVVNRRHMENAKYNDSDDNLALEKYIYRKLLNTALNADPTARFVVRLDEGREKTYPPEDMRRMLNHGFRKENTKGLRHSPFNSVKALPSKHDRFIQAADVLSGAVAWVWNKRYLKANKNEDKESLATLVGELFDTQVTSTLAKVRSVKRGTYLSLGYQTQQRAERGFSIWDFDLRHDARLARVAESKAQFAVFPEQTRFGDLTRDGWKISLECVYCGNGIKNALDNPYCEQFNRKRVGTPSRPLCMECGRERVAILAPRRRDRLAQFG